MDDDEDEFAGTELEPDTAPIPELGEKPGYDDDPQAWLVGTADCGEPT